MTGKQKSRKRKTPPPSSPKNRSRSPRTKKPSSPFNQQKPSSPIHAQLSSSNESISMLTSDDNISTIKTRSSSSSSTISSSPSISNNQTGSQKDDASPLVTKPAIRPPPIFINKSSDWRKVAPVIFKNAIVSPQNISAQATSDGSIIIKTLAVDHFRLIQKTLIDHKILFKTSNLPEERTLKVVIRGIPTDISTDELKSELELLNFDVKLVKRFGPVNKPMPICLVILGNTQNSKHIYEVSDLFFIKVTVESYKKTGPSQCFACQRTGHGSSNCSHPLRCVKCSGEHKASACPKTKDQDPTCCNCGGKHTANYRGCPYLAQAQTSNQVKILPPAPPTQLLQSTANNPKNMDYANATKSEQIISNKQIIFLLTDLLSAISNNDDPKAMLLSTIKSFLSLLNTQQ